MITIRYGGASTAGSLRPGNEDNLFLQGVIRPLKETDFVREGISSGEDQLYAVCDGMGGEQAGEIASLMTALALRQCLGKNMFENYRRLIEEINRCVCVYQKERGISIGSTLSALIVRGSRFVAVNVGDSRIYRVGQDALERLSRDQTEFQMLLDAGVFKESDRAKSVGSHRLLQYLGMPKEERPIEPCVFGGEIRAGDRFLLCSDGLIEGLTEEQIFSVVAGDGRSGREGGPASLSGRCGILLQKAMDGGSRDNVTAVLLEAQGDGQTV